MRRQQWESGKPPHNTTVEVEYEGKILKGKAIWGDRDAGVLPHWKLSNGVLVEPRGVTKWRYK